MANKTITRKGKRYRLLSTHRKLSTMITAKTRWQFKGYNVITSNNVPVREFKKPFEKIPTSAIRFYIYGRKK